ncbi:hypothetical protein RI367_006209 [Sorochytrium milnesiophthora]
MSTLLCIVCAAPASDDDIRVPSGEMDFPSRVIAGLHPRDRRWRKRPVGVFANAVTCVGVANEEQFYVDKVAEKRPAEHDGYESDDGDDNRTGGQDMPPPSDDTVWHSPTACLFDVGHMKCAAFVAHDVCLRLAAAWCDIKADKRHHVFKDKYDRFGIDTVEVSCNRCRTADCEWTPEHAQCLAVHEPETEYGRADYRSKLTAADHTQLLEINYGAELLDLVSSNAAWVHENRFDMHFFRPDTFPALPTYTHRSDSATDARNKAGLLGRLPPEVFLHILRMLAVKTGSFTSEIADIPQQLSDKTVLFHLARTCRYMHELIGGPLAATQVWLSQCRELGWLPTEADTTTSARAVRSVMTTGDCDWMAYYRACMRSPHMIKRLYVHERVADIRRLAQADEQKLY